VPRNEQGGNFAPGVPALASTLFLSDGTSSSDAPARPATSPNIVSADATLQTNWSLAAALLDEIGDSGTETIRRLKF